MDPLDTRINIELDLEHERKWMENLKIACVTPKGRDPVFAKSVVWLIGKGNILEIANLYY